MNDLPAKFLLFLGWVALPLWLFAGFGDWLCHRRARIDHTSGPGESALHVLLFALVAAPIAGSLFSRPAAGCSG